MLFTLSLLGPFRLQRPDGERIEIPSKKGLALIAMLAMAEEGERTRSWLQDKLWGRRQHAEARGSLRRELSNLRKLLNQDQAAEPLLLFERDRVRLRIDLIEIDARRPAGAHAGDAPSIRGEFLEGLDIPGEEGFEDWLREQRRERAKLSERTQQALAAQQDGSLSGRPAPLPSHILDLTQVPPGFAGRQALAVLPFANITGDSNCDYLAEGISEELIERLSCIRWLPVIARSSSFALPGNEDRGLIGRTLGAKYLVEGRLHRVQDAYVLAATLLDAASNHTVWSHRFVLGTEISGTALEQVASELVAHLEMRIDRAEQGRIRDKRQSPLSLTDLIWRGRWHLNRLTRADSEMAQKLFAEALALDPDSAEALIQSTFALGWAIWAQRESRDRIMDMRKLAQRAMQADPDDGRGYMLCGISEMWLRHPQSAQTLLEQSISLNPSMALAYGQLGCSFNLLGTPERAVQPLRTGLRLSAADPNIFFTLNELALAFGMLGQWDDAIEHADHSLARRPAYWWAHVIKIDALVRSGRLAGATAALHELLAVKPNFTARYLDWIPFLDRAFVGRYVESLKAVPIDRVGWLERESEGSEGLPV
jgi:TolB-like protein/Flp pilus assembly protein TadD